MPVTYVPHTKKEIKKSLSQVTEVFVLVGPRRLELPTSPLSGARSNQLSYGPACLLDSENTIQQPTIKINVFFNYK